MMNTNTPITKAEFDACLIAIHSFRVNELHQLLSHFKCPTIGSKQQLVSWAYTILENPRLQHETLQKVWQIQQASAILANGGSSNQPSYSTQTNMHIQQHWHQHQHYHPYPYPINPQLNMTFGRGSQSQYSTVETEEAYHHQHHHHHNGYINAVPPAAGVYGNPNNFLAAHGHFPINNTEYFPHHFSHIPHPPPPPPPPSSPPPPSPPPPPPPPPVRPTMPMGNQRQMVVKMPMQPYSSSNNRAQTIEYLKYIELPFYDFVKPIIKMTELVPSPNHLAIPGNAHFSADFFLLPEDILKLSYAPSNREQFPRYELQLRVFLLEINTNSVEQQQQQKDAFPPNSVVHLDGKNVILPQFIPTASDAEQKREPRPVDLTHYCQPFRGHKHPYRITIEWHADLNRAWGFTIALVHHVNSEILLARMRKKPEATKTFATTKAAIIQQLNGGGAVGQEEENDVQMDSLKWSLIDPISLKRIKIPARAKGCTHLKSFDLMNYLMLNEKRPDWKCPECRGNAPYSELLIENYFEHVLNVVRESADEVLLLPDGNWRLPNANYNFISLDLDTGTVAETQQHQKGDTKGIICLSSDDEDEESQPCCPSVSNRLIKQRKRNQTRKKMRRKRMRAQQQALAQQLNCEQQQIGAATAMQNEGCSSTVPQQSTETQAIGQQSSGLEIDETSMALLAQHLAQFLQNALQMRDKTTVNDPHSSLDL